MAKLSWITPASTEMVRELATNGVSNLDIAAQVTKAFGIFVNDNMVAGRIGRMPEIPPRIGTKVTKRDAFEWVSHPKPTWGTPEADAVVLKAKLKSISTYKIGGYFGVSDNTVTAALRRARQKNKIAGYDAQMKVLAEHESTEWPVTRIARLIKLYEQRLSYAEIRADAQIRINGANPSHASVQKKIQRLRDAGLVTEREDHTPSPRCPSSKRAVYAETVKPSVNPVKINPVTIERTGASNLRLLRGGLALAGFDKVILCAWSGCKKPAVGKWCHHHEQLLRAPASEISQRLAEWK